MKKALWILPLVFLLVGCGDNDDIKWMNNGGAVYARVTLGKDCHLYLKFDTQGNGLKNVDVIMQDIRDCQDGVMQP